MVDGRDLANRLQSLPQLRDVGVLPEADDRMAVLVALQGFTFGAVVRNAVIGAAPEHRDAMRVAIVDEIPRKPEGGLDAAAAHETLAACQYVYEYDGPKTDQEVSLARMLEELFDTAPVSMTDDLPSLGADSLLTMELVAMLSEGFGADLDPQALFAASSIREVVALLGDGET